MPSSATLCAPYASFSDAQYPRSIVVVLYAHTPAGNRIEPTPNAKAVCTLCGLPLIPKCGPINIWHWSHRAHDCDPWSEPESDWHRGWKRRVDPDWCEVTLKPHRADIRRPDGLVIELQKSSISAVDIAAREAFYGNMWWLLHRERLGKKAMFFLGEGRRFRLRWLNGSRTLPRVTKPVFCDLGGPIVEFTEPFDSTGGLGNLLSRGEFLQRAGFPALTAEERAQHSHWEARFPFSPKRSDDVKGAVVVEEPASGDIDRRTVPGSVVTRYRLDDSHDEPFLAPPRTPRPT